MAQVNKANQPRRSPGMTRNNRPRLRSLGIAQLEDLYTKTSSARAKGKVLNELNRKKANIKTVA
jgi:hypothetical protein